MITKFSGQYEFLNLAYKCNVALNGHVYSSAMAAYWAAHTTDPFILATLRNPELSPYEAQKIVKRMQWRQDWTEIEEDVLSEITLDKFTRGAKLRSWLLKTLPQRFRYENNWHDNDLGVCICQRRGLRPKYGTNQDCAGENGKNLLGKCLMAVRKQLDIEDQVYPVAV